jgi:hypothetical protein
MPPWQEIRLCVMEDGTPREVPALYDFATGDTMVGGRPFAEAYPVTPVFAADKEWYVQNELIVLDGRRFVKYGRTRILGSGRVVPLGRTYGGVPLYTEGGDHEFPSAVLYVPVRPACEFQSYQWDLVTGGVRG